MRLISTSGASPSVDLGEALRRGLAPDGGLYWPESIPRLAPSASASISDKGLADIASTVLAPYFEGLLDDGELARLLAEALDFPIPLVSFGDGIWILELFHGPTLAFKDVAARVLARVLPRLDDAPERGPLTVLTATSGDTGGAVAQAFFDVPGTRVAVLYPRGRVTPIQERQIATLGGNVRAYAVDGSFDDCQRLVKAAFADPALEAARLTSANSINFGRLLPQAVYYFHAAAQLDAMGERRPPTFCVPSGNFGNLTAGLLAASMGLAASGFVAATNINDAVPAYLEHGIYRARPTRATMSSAMDVGDPSNLARIRHLFGDDVSALRKVVTGVRVDEGTTASVLRETAASGHDLDPHTAVGIAAAREVRKRRDSAPVVVLATAHAAKFAEVVTPLWGRVPKLPERLRVLLDRPNLATPLAMDSSALRRALLAWPRA